MKQSSFDFNWLNLIVLITFTKYNSKKFAIKYVNMTFLVFQFVSSNDVVLSNLI
jgi:hypothetical protein